MKVRVSPVKINKRVNARLKKRLVEGMRQLLDETEQSFYEFVNEEVASVVGYKHEDFNDLVEVYADDALEAAYKERTVSYSRRT